MRFSKEQIRAKVEFENQWWATNGVSEFYQNMNRREYFRLFLPLVKERNVKRAIVLMGPRRVGKTVMIFQAIQELINSGVPARKICYFSIETPLLNGIALEELLNIYFEINFSNAEAKTGIYLFFDEIQYLKKWEVHLKSLVDSYHDIKFVVSGSAAAALKLKSNESGAGRFTDFVLPPLTFHEYLSLTGKSANITKYTESQSLDGSEIVATEYKSGDIDLLNEYFVEYINFGGYPEVSLSAHVRSDPSRYIRNDIIDKVLLRDLPSLYGIQDIQELNSLFTYLAYNSGSELSLDGISKNSGVAKNTIKRYVSYLEAAFLIRVVNRIDFNAKRFKRANFFKVYLTNPSLRSALFSPIDKRDPQMGNMVETAIFSQWQHSGGLPLFYARWDSGEVDLVYLGARQKPSWCVEIKWSNRFAENPNELKNLRTFMLKNKLGEARVTTIDIEKRSRIDDILIRFTPASVYCYTVGKNIVEGKSIREYDEVVKAETSQN